MISKETKKSFGVGDGAEFGDLTLKISESGEMVSVVIARELGIVSTSMKVGTLADIIEDWIFKEPVPRYPGLPMSEAQLTDHCEKSKRDVVILVGSEVRQLIGEILHWRKVLGTK